MLWFRGRFSAVIVCVCLQFLIMVRATRSKTSGSSTKKKEENIPSVPDSPKPPKSKRKRTSALKESNTLKPQDEDIKQAILETNNNYYKEQFQPDNDIFTKILASKKTFPNTCEFRRTFAHRPQHNGSNVVHSYHQHCLGNIGLNKLKKSVSSPVVSLVQDLQLCRTASPFDRRCTSMEWHPTHPHLIATGSKGGDLILWNISDTNKDLFIQGRGPGGSISSLKFHPSVPTKIYTSALDGKVAVQDFSGKKSDVFLDTMCWERWYCSLDANLRTSQLAVGDTKGEVTLLSLSDGKKAFSGRLHKQKVSHTEFSRRDDWTLVTASLDKTVKVWDLRMMKDSKSCVHTLTHDKPINSAYFSLTDGYRLLVTDQHQDIIVYDSATWQVERTIPHPHRFFQHITPIKAHWHPLADLIVIGRYPDPKFPSYVEGEARTIDVYSADTGDRVAQLSDPAAPGIVSLNKFNPRGDMLASTMGVNMLLWKRREEVVEKQRALMGKMKQSTQGQRSSQLQSTQGQRSSQPRQRPAAKTQEGEEHQSHE